MENLFPYLCVDIFVIAVSLIVMRKQLVFLHPFTMYLFFHIIVISARAWQLYYGSPPMYADNDNFENIRESEFIRAIWMADVALVFFCFFSWLGQFKLVPNKNQAKRKNELPLDISIARKVCYVCLPIGLVLFTLVKSGIPLPDTSYFVAFAQWFICCLLILMFAKGFKPELVIPAMIYLSFVAIQGYHRTQLILPVIFLIGLAIINERRNWPSKPAVIFIIIGALIFPQLKFFGDAMTNEDYGKALDYLIHPFVQEQLKNKPSSIQFLDQYAGSLTMLDNKGEHYYGKTYLGMLTLPIPRFLWPEKPGLGDHIIEVSTQSRQYNLEGRIITYIGESYFNFGYFGIVIIPSLLAYALSRWFNILTKQNKKSLQLCFWLFIYSSLIQVFRDGLSSLVTFTIMINTPIFFIAILTLFTKKLRGY